MKLQKTKLLQKANAKGLYYFSNILDSVLDAVYIEQISKLPKGDIEIQILHISNQKKELIYLLKTVSYKNINDINIANIKKEYEIAAKLGKGNPYIAKGVSISEYRDITNNLFNIELLFEYGGYDLLTWVSKGATGMDILEIAVLSIEAIAFAHSERIYHLDLRPQNILFRKGEMKIINFALNTMQESSCYCPPELKKSINKFRTEHNFSKEKVDVFSWGMIFYQILSKKEYRDLKNECKKCLENEENYNTFKSEISKLKFKGEASTFSRNFTILLNMCLSFSPLDRPSFEDMKINWIPLFEKATSKETEKLEESLEELNLEPILEETREEVLENKYYKWMQNNKVKEINWSILFG